MDLTQSACCQMLGLPENAPLEEVRRAYRRLARRLHPDISGGDSARFSEITAAYNVLTGRCAAAKDEVPRAAPTRPRSAADEAAHARAYAEFCRRAAHLRPTDGGRPPRPPVEPTVDSPSVEPNERVSAFEAKRNPNGVTPPSAAGARSGGSLWQRLRAALTRRRVVGLFSHFSRRRTAGVRADGQDLHLTLAVDLDTILRGGEQRFFVQRAAACPSCVGGGDVDCVCAGSGRILLREKLKVQVPPGAKAGAKMRLASKGNEALGGRASGDLFLVLEPAQLSGWLRDGADLRADLEVGGELARIGGPLNVPTPWGPIRLDVPASTRTGTKFRLRGQGLPVWQRTARGDLYLRVQVV